MKDRMSDRIRSKDAAILVGILLFISLILILGTIREISNLLTLGSIQEMVSTDGRLELLGNDTRAYIGGYPLADIPAPTYRTTPEDISWGLTLGGHALLTVLSDLALLVSALSIARFFYEVSGKRTLTFVGASAYFRRAAIALTVGLVVLPLISYFFYQVTIGNSSFNLSYLLIHIAVILFLEFFGRLLKESSELKQEAEQFL